MDEPLVLLRQVSGPFLAEICRLTLEAEDIPCRVLGSHLTAIHGGMDFMVELWVRAGDASFAAEILAVYEAASAPHSQADAEDAESDFASEPESADSDPFDSEEP
ncbi:MAG TPA: DUF2007 domain-containing protein [Gemmatales bacterium]|nr:DUF2007 domain-containing protein [Gemmatales bacterium]HMP59915.1 DUF2007 domain-containing protein [Gemmatales bacterium]